MNTPYIKLSAQGNEFVVMDCRSIDALPPQAIVPVWADRATGIGFDQLLVLKRRQNSPAFDVTIFNADGSLAEQCGNGMRALAHYIYHTIEEHRPRVALYPPAGEVIIQSFEPINATESRVRVSLPGPRDISPTPIPAGLPALSATRVSMGNPHWILGWPQPPTEQECQIIGAKLQEDPSVIGGINVSLAYFDGDLIHLRVYERGVGPTLACGSGACASCAAMMVRTNKGDQIIVRQPGGEVMVTWPSKISPELIELCGNVQQLDHGFLQWNSCP